MAHKNRWNDLSVVSRWRIAILGITQLALQFVVLRDLIRRPASGIRGAKGAWAAASFVNFLGPIAYLTLGRVRNK